LLLFLYTIGENITSEGPIESTRKYEELRQEPYPLPKEFKWCLIDINEQAEVSDIIDT
jgi:glycylpeptide N-tetradecanoyltransferase